MTLDADLAPLSGNPAALADRAADATRSTAALDDGRAAVRRVVAALADQDGGAVQAARGRLTAAAEHLATCSGVLGATASTLRRHADALAGAQHEAARALAERAAAVARERHWQAELDDARRSTWNTVAVGVPVGVPVGLDAAAADPAADPVAAHLRAVAAERGLAAARADVTAAEGRWRAARDAKVDASRRATAALRSLGDVRSLQVARAHGLSVPEYQASAAEARHAQALLSAVTGAASAATVDRTARRDALLTLFARHRDDPAFWAVFWDAATPGQLCLALGPAYDQPFSPPSGELMTTLRGGVEQWARTATPGELATFGASVVEGIGEYPLGLTGRSEIAAALLPPTLPAPVFAAAGDALDARRDRPVGTATTPALDDVELAAIAPLAVAVLAGTARHPRLALDRLAPAACGREDVAVRRWLGTQPRGGWPDGGTAVTGVLAAAVRAGASSTDPADQRRAALLVSHATTQLPTGLLAGPTLSDRASTQVALAYEPYLTSMGDATEAQTRNQCVNPEPAPAPGTNPGFSLAEGAGIAAPTVQPQLDAFALRDVISATSRTPGAADAWLGATDRYAERMADLATSGDHDVDTGPRTSIVHETLSDVGAVAGAMQAATISTAQSRVEMRESLVSVANTGLGVASISLRATESAVATAGSAGLSFLATDAPLREANLRVATTQENLLAQYAVPLHDAVVEHDLTLGFSPAEAELRAEAVGPDERDDGQYRWGFDASFRDLARAPKEGEC